MIKRRKLLVALGVGALTIPHASFAQKQPPKVARIGLLEATSASSHATRTEALRAGLREVAG